MGKRSSKSKSGKRNRGGSPRRTESNNAAPSGTRSGDGDDRASNRAHNPASGSMRPRIRCTGCGASLEPDARFCHACGYTMAGSSASAILFFIGALALAVSAASSYALVYNHVTGIALPGCGLGSACAELARGEWGKVPFIQWPVSFVGAAYFSGALIAWLVARGAIPGSFRNLVRLGVLFSVMFAIVMIAKGQFCKYCIAAHAGNLVFWLVAEKIGRSVPTFRPIVATAAVFLLASVTMGVVESRQEERTLTKLHDDIEESTKKALADTLRKSRAYRSEDGGSETPVDRAGTESVPAAPTFETQYTNQAGGFTGRYRYGPETARVRIVMITDYQCKDCIAVEVVARRIVETNPDVSFSVKHFPMSEECNRNFVGKPKPQQHQFACRAARAAEAAGLIGGNDLFWKMHHWLFDQRGGFAEGQADLSGFLASVGVTQQQFDAAMTNPITLQNVKADIEEAIGLGLFFTPMVFINGTQIKGVFERSARRLTAVVDNMLKSAIEPATSAIDRPPFAREKYLSDWRTNPKRRFLPDNADWSRGDPNSRLRVVLFGDYQEPGCAKVDRIIRGWIGDRQDVYYAFRHYPFNQKCNPKVSRTAFERSCEGAQAAEAAGILGGKEGYWKVHNWLFDNQKAFEAGDDVLRAALPGMGLDPIRFFQTTQDPAVGAAIAEDAIAATRLGLRGIPMIFVNDRYVTRWDRKGDRILERILAEAEGVPFPGD